VAAPDTATRSTAETARAYFDAVEQRDVQAMAACWKPGSVDHLHGVADLSVPEDLKHWFGNLFAAFPDFTMVVMDLISEGDQAAVRWKATGTFTGDARFEGFIANDAKLETEGLDLLTVSDGLIVDNRAYTNALDQARQIGAIPPQGSAADRAMTEAFNLKTRAVRALRRD
jgi:ketosteroid isomerase-like protein